jgi:hypothetical protein
MGNLLDKLIRVERFLQVYTLKRNKLNTEYSVDHIELETIRNIVHPPEDDVEIYDNYELNEKQISKFNEFLPKKIKPKMDVYFYVLVSVGIYK